MIAEGFATAASIREATGLPVVIAFDAGNLAPVAKIIRRWLPLARIVIAADDDHATDGNPGLTKAHAAAELIGGNVATPTFLETEQRGTDFNDLAALRGPEPVAEIIRAAFEEKADEPEPTPDPAPMSKPTAAATAQSAEDWEMPLLVAVEELNAKHFVVTVRRADRHRDADPETMRSGASFWSSRRNATSSCATGTGTTWSASRREASRSGKAWARHGSSIGTGCNYERIALIPKGAVPADTYNLWRGFGVEPKAGDWPLIRQHLLEVVCSGNESDCRWLIGWMARAVQYPELHAEVAVVLRGLKGTGKGTLGQILHRLFRHHAMHISNPPHFTGRFNGHLVDVLFLFVDEAFWAGDKAGEGTLKALVTEPTIPIEPKFVNLFQTTNRLKILMASNADWVVPATADERRYFVLDVSDCRRGDRGLLRQAARSDRRRRAAGLPRPSATARSVRFRPPQPAAYHGAQPAEARRRRQPDELLARLPHQCRDRRDRRIRLARGRRGPGAARRLRRPRARPWRSATALRQPHGREIGQADARWAPAAHPAVQAPRREYRDRRAMRSPISTTAGPPSSPRCRSTSTAGRRWASETVQTRRQGRTEGRRWSALKRLGQAFGQARRLPETRRKPCSVSLVRLSQGDFDHPYMREANQCACEPEPEPSITPITLSLM